MSLEDIVRRYYADIAEDYDRIAGYTEPENEPLREPIKARFQELFRGLNVLEIACGTGYWTQVIGQTAGSVYATDVNPELLLIAAKRCAGIKTIRFGLADAYSLAGVSDGFDAAFAHWWWSHMPKDLIRTFLLALHSKLKPGALVVFRDQLPSTYFEKAEPVEGNNLEVREVPGSSTVGVVKNYPGEQEVREVLEELADDIRYLEFPDERSWDVIYRKR